jgi:hypothetical protein
MRPSVSSVVSGPPRSDNVDLRVERNDLDPRPAALNDQSRDAWPNIESSWASGTGIDAQSLLPLEDHGTMSMTEHQYFSRVSRQHQFRRRPAELVAMADMNRDAANRNHALPCQRRIVRIVDVAVHRFSRRDRSQRFEHGLAADIAGMEDQINVGEYRRNIGTYQPVRVRNEPDDGGCPHLPPAD